MSDLHAHMVKINHLVMSFQLALNSVCLIRYVELQTCLQLRIICIWSLPGLTETAGRSHLLMWYTWHDSISLSFHIVFWLVCLLLWVVAAVAQWGIWSKISNSVKMWCPAFFESPKLQIGCRCMCFLSVMEDYFFGLLIEDFTSQLALVCVSWISHCWAFNDISYRHYLMRLVLLVVTQRLTYTGLCDTFKWSLML